MAKKYIYFFGGGKGEGKGDMKDLLGGKGAGLAEMTNIGLPVPAGFTITTEVCDYYYRNNKKYPQGFADGSRRTSRPSKSSSARSSATPMTHCSSPSAQARPEACPA